MSGSTMQAIRFHQYGGPEELKLELTTRPEPAEGEVLVRVHSAGVLPIDWKIRQGLFKFPVVFPSIPGTSFAGVIEDVGSGVSTFQKGQAVFGRSTKGTYSEFTVASKEAIALLPPSISFDEAATLSGGATTAWMALILDGELKPGDRVLIHGAAGGVGLFAVQFAKWKGAHVTGTAGTANIDFVRSLGADTVIDYTSTPFEQAAHEMDLILDTVGKDTLERSWPLVKRGGILISTTAQPSLEKAEELGIRVLKPSRLASKQDLEDIVQLIAHGHVKPVIFKTFSLHEAQQAHELSQLGHGRGRIVLHIAD